MEIQNQQTNIEDWRNDIKQNSQVLKVKDGETVKCVVIDEGKKIPSKDFGDSIAFQVIVDGEKEQKTFFVSCRNFALLSQIKDIGKLTGQHVSIQRAGSKKSDTRYWIKKV